MKFAVDEPEQNIRLIDYDETEANDFLATNQFRVEGPKDNIRTDLLLFVNGIPLVNIEAKTTARDWHVDWTEGALNNVVAMAAKHRSSTTPMHFVER